MNIFIKILKYLTGFATSYYIGCVIEKRIVGFDNAFSADSIKVFLDHPGRRIFILLIVTVVLIVLNEFDLRIGRTKEQKLISLVCEQIFKKHIDPISGIDNSKIRVSIHKARRLTCGKIRLMNIGRFQRSAPLHFSKVRMRIGEGCVGKCFEINEIVKKELKSNESDRSAYLKEMFEKTSLPKRKIRRLNQSSVSFYSIPIRKYGSSERLWGVLTFDSKQKRILDKIDFRKIEETLQTYNLVFCDGEVA